MSLANDGTSCYLLIQSLKLIGYVHTVELNIYIKFEAYLDKILFCVKFRVLN